MNSFKTGYRYLLSDPVLLAAALYPVVVILLLRLAVNPVSDLIFLKAGLRLGVYYTILAITIISVIPVLLGFIYAFIYLDKSETDRFKIILITPAGKKSLQYFRMIVPVLLSFIIVLITNLITNPVPTEGWLRSVFVSGLLSLQSLFVLIFIGSLASNRSKAILLLKLYGILLAAIPFGLLLHHPWNYILFFSPYYWIGWAWVCDYPPESLLYGAISAAISLGCIIWIYSHLIKKNKT